MGRKLTGHPEYLEVMACEVSQQYLHVQENWISNEQLVNLITMKPWVETDREWLCYNNGGKRSSRPEKPRTMPLTEGILEKKGSRVTVLSYMSFEAMITALSASEIQSHSPGYQRDSGLKKKIGPVNPQKTCWGTSAWKVGPQASSWPQKSRALPLVIWRKGRGCRGVIKNS